MALSPTTLVNVDADMALKLAEFIGSKLSAPEEFVSECQKSIDACQALELVGRFLDKHELLLDLENDEGKRIELTTQAIRWILPHWVARSPVHLAFRIVCSFSPSPFGLAILESCLRACPNCPSQM